MDNFLQRALEVTENVTASLTSDELVRHKPGKWCVAEILEHLSRAYSSTSKLMQRHLDSGKPTADEPTAKERMLVETVIEAENLRSGQQAPEFTLPLGIAPDQALPQFRETLTAMDEIITRCEKNFGSEIPIAKHGIFGPLTARQWRRFHWAHTAHHAKQIEELRRQAAGVPCDSEKRR